MAVLSDFRTRVSAKTGLETTAGSTELALIDSWANEAVRDILIRTHCFIDRGTMTTTAGERDYDLPTSILAIVEFLGPDTNAVDRPLLRLSPIEILRERAQSSTTNQAYVTKYAVQGSNQLLLYPTPASTMTLTIYYVPKPTEMSGGSHDPSTATYGGIPSEWHKAIEYYMLWQAGDYDDDSSSGQGERYRLLYEGSGGEGGYIKKIRESIKRKGSRRGTRAVVNGRWRTYFPYHPSADIWRYG